jgi:FlaG/FlaF family flagellin (archaellin)
MFMHFWQQKENTETDDGVSAVIGVMLMLSVVVILAVVVSMYAGNLAVFKEQTPQVTLQCAISRGPTDIDAVFQMFVSSSSSVVKTSDVQIVTSWSALNSSMQTIYGGNTTTGKPDGSQKNTPKLNMPYGIGPGVSGEVKTSVDDMTDNQSFGAYTLVPNTILRAATPDGMKAVLGEGWTDLSPGDKVRVKMIYLPTSGLLYDNVVVVL